MFFILAESVLSSSYITFALDACVARSTGNAVMFFKLMKTGTYLQACLLSMFADEMRFVYIERLPRAMKEGKKETRFLVSDLVRMLMFEDEEDALDFLSHCGFQLFEEVQWLTI